MHSGQSVAKCGCSSSSTYGWTRGVWVRGDGTGARRSRCLQAVTPRLARTLAEMPGGPLEWASWACNAECSARARCFELRGNSELSIYDT
jgi:hypothetical protein